MRLMLPPSTCLTKLHHPFRARLDDIQQSVAADRHVVHGPEYWLARLSEADGGDDVPAAIELQYSVCLRFVIVAADTDIDRACVVDDNGEDAAAVFGAQPVANEALVAVENLDARVLVIGDQQIAVRRKRQAVRIVELGRAGPAFPPFAQKAAARIEERDAAVHVAVADV